MWLMLMLLLVLAAFIASQARLPVEVCTPSRSLRRFRGLKLTLESRVATLGPGGQIALQLLLGQLALKSGKAGSGRTGSEIHSIRQGFTSHFSEVIYRGDLEMSR